MAGQSSLLQREAAFVTMAVPRRRISRLNRMTKLRLLPAGRSAYAGLVAALIFAAACAPRDAPTGPGTPTPESNRTESSAAAPHFMAVGANPLAVEVGRDVLARGGNAVDAAIAMQMVLNLVEPQSSGIGGGGFLLYYDAASGAVTTYDGRETAPAAATPDMFLAPDGNPKEFFAAAIGGGAVGVPGVVAMLEMAHRDHGRMSWGELFDPAIRMAEDGFAVSPRFHAMSAADSRLKTFPETAAYFFHPDGSPRATGEILKNPALAKSLRAIADGGAEAFYDGAIARDIAVAVNNVPVNPGRLTPSDFAHYHAERREPVCGAYRQWRVCGMPPPSSGGVTLLETLGMLESFDLKSLAPESLEAVHLVAEANRLAFADRNRYLADPAFMRNPVQLLLDHGYLESRAQLISRDRALDRVRPGSIGAANPGFIPPPQTGSSTTHMTIVDTYGNAVAFTSTIEAEFGSRLMVDGFLLNNELTDFSFRPEIAGEPAANRPGPGKRPLSSMAPTFVFDRDGHLVLALGSPGGQAIIGYVLKTMIGVLDWSMKVQDAIDLPNFATRGGPIVIEQGTPLTGLKDSLTAMGHKVELRELTSGLHAIAVTPHGLEGGADPRREGIARGG